MDKALEERISALERTLGVDLSTDAQSSDLDVHSVRKSLEKKGLNKVLKVPIERLRSLKAMTDQMDNRPLSDKLSTVECCEQLIRQRAGLLEQFEAKMKVVQDCEKLTGASSHGAEISKIEDDIKAVIESWNQHSQELHSFHESYLLVTSALRSRVDELEQQVAAAEQRVRTEAE